jgi:hypothetical protein
MDKVHKPITTQYYTPSSKPFRNLSKTNTPCHDWNPSSSTQQSVVLILRHLSRPHFPRNKNIITKLIQITEHLIYPRFMMSTRWYASRLHTVRVHVFGTSNYFHLPCSLYFSSKDGDKGASCFFETQQFHTHYFIINKGDVVCLLTAVHF